MAKTIQLSDREVKLIERWKMSSVNRIPELQFLIMKSIISMLNDESLNFEQARLVDNSELGESHIIYDFDYGTQSRFDLEVVFKSKEKVLSFKPFYLDGAKISYTLTIKAAMNGYEEQGG
ncbi:hypothetical protein VNN37_10235 (plasmid) [Lactococcus garvieae]|uniref:hypothetical protein n=1 Tax=Lactococcus garvieae TaxID=1363 RepID=UPI0030D0FAB8